MGKYLVDSNVTLLVSTHLNQCCYFLRHKWITCTMHCLSQINGEFKLWKRWSPYLILINKRFNNTGYTYKWVVVFFKYWHTSQSLPNVTSHDATYAENLSIHCYTSILFHNSIRMRRVRTMNYLVRYLFLVLTEVSTITKWWNILTYEL